MQQRFGLGCVSGTVAHAAFYPLEVSEIRDNFECFIVSVLFVGRMFISLAPVEKMRN